mgnify:CR=1 FL=1
MSSSTHLLKLIKRNSLRANKNTVGGYIEIELVNEERAFNHRKESVDQKIR